MAKREPSPEGLGHRGRMTSAVGAALYRATTPTCFPCPVTGAAKNSEFTVKETLRSLPAAMERIKSYMVDEGQT